MNHIIFLYILTSTAHPKGTISGRWSHQFLANDKSNAGQNEQDENGQRGPPGISFPVTFAQIAQNHNAQEKAGNEAANVRNVGDLVKNIYINFLKSFVCDF